MKVGCITFRKRTRNQSKVVLNEMQVKFPVGEKEASMSLLFHHFAVIVPTLPLKLQTLLSIFSEQEALICEVLVMQPQLAIRRQQKVDKESEGLRGSHQQSLQQPVTQ